MTMRLFPLLIAFSLSACSQIKVDDAEVTNPKDISIERIQFKTLNTDARKALNAANPDAVIVVFDDSGVTLYGAPGKAFKLESEEQLNRQSSKTSKVDSKEPVNDVVIKTYVNSPMCQYFLIAGNRYWYPSNCPH